MGLLVTATAAAALNCWAAAANKYNLPVELLYAIGKVESNYVVGAVGKNTDGTRDLGVMQINSSWLPTLAPFGIGEKELLEQPCTNIQVGAWILSMEVRRFGYTWYAIGAYNAGPLTPKMSAERRARKIATYRAYSGKVLARWKALRAKTTKPQAVAVEAHNASG